MQKLIIINFPVYPKCYISNCQKTRKKETVERRYGDMMEVMIGVAALVPSLYWTAAVAASVKTIAEEEK